MAYLGFSDENNVRGQTVNSVLMQKDFEFNLISHVPWEDKIVLLRQGK